MIRVRDNVMVVMSHKWFLTDEWNRPWPVRLDFTLMKIFKFKHSSFNII